MGYTDAQVEKMMAQSFDRGYQRGISIGLEMAKYESPVDYFDKVDPRVFDDVRKQRHQKIKRPKRIQTGKQKILTRMAKKAWDKYKKGNGKKSYIDIRAPVSRSQAYKKKTKGM